MSVEVIDSVSCKKCRSLMHECVELKGGARISMSGHCKICGNSYNSDDYAQLGNSDFVDDVRAGKTAVVEKECFVCGGIWKEQQMDVLEPVDGVGDNMDICIDCLAGI